MGANRTHHRTSLRLWMAVVLVAALGIIWLLVQRNHRQRDEVPLPTDATQNGRSNKPEANRLATRVPSKQTQINRTSPLAEKAGSRPDPLDRETMLRCLKGWIEKREGRDVEVVSSQDIRSLDGRTVAMNVLVTTNLGSGLTTIALKELLAAAYSRERVLRKQLQEAYQAGDIASVNRLAGELTESRTTFVMTNGVASYKLSFSKELPPVLAFWPGLPFETVREESARTVATTRLKGDIGLEGLVYYTSATALLCFTNNTGARIYVDPFRVQEVPLTAFQSLRTERPRRADDRREARISAQWDEFLNADSANPNK